MKEKNIFGMVFLICGLIGIFSSYYIFQVQTIRVMLVASGLFCVIVGIMTLLAHDDVFKEKENDIEVAQKQ